MAEHFGSPLTAIAMLLALTGVSIAVGAYVIAKVRSKLNANLPTPSELLTRFQELHAKGELTDAEYRKIKAMLVERQQHELRGKEEQG